jgi:hypothetical protein
MSGSLLVCEEPIESRPEVARYGGRIALRGLLLCHSSAYNVVVIAPASTSSVTFSTQGDFSTTILSTCCRLQGLHVNSKAFIDLPVSET